MADPFTLSLTAASGLKTAIEITKTIVDVRDGAKLAAVKSELLGLLLEAQEEKLALVAQKRELAQRVSDLEAWDGEKERYDMKDVGQGCIAYTIKPEAQGAEPSHSICADCYQRGQKSILQPFTIPAGRAQGLRCHACRSEMVIQGADLRPSPGFRGHSPLA